MVTFTINNMKIAYPPSSDNENSRWVQGVWPYDFEKGVHRNGHFLSREMDKDGPQWSLSLVKNFLSKAVHLLVKVYKKEQVRHCKGRFPTYYPIQ